MKRKKTIRTAGFFLMVISLIACSCADKTHKLSDEEIEKLHEPLIKANSYLTRKDEELIVSYIKRRNWEMKVTDRGLYYMIYEHGKGRKAEKGLIARISYSISLLDGTLCYSSDSLGPKSFVIHKENVESGLDEGILLLHEGDKARFIMPPYLAYGLVGDDNRIPMRSIIVYDLEVLKIEEAFY
ncbi:MAG: FKBP-type peptidyl-prolyl cis-trans isomerase [Bacteroidetes bacterium]|nr:FKBP-type peptidyl-prolyl cis-trans isomerase [Bacteroidota bacterium]